MFVIRSMEVSKDKRRRMYYADDDDSFIANRLHDGESGEFALNQCPQFDGLNYNRAELPESWTNQYEDYWYVRFAVVQNGGSVATHDQCMAATLALEKPQWRFKFQNVNAAAPHDLCSDPACFSDTLTMNEAVEAHIKYQTIDSGETEGETEEVSDLGQNEPTNTINLTDQVNDLLRPKFVIKAISGSQSIVSSE